MARRTPNAEQCLAIEHDGGVLLEAGAGSGKTFVLVEHMVYRLQCFFQEHSNVPPDEWRQALTSTLRGMVLMTFTRKAAGEMALRLQRRFEEAAVDARDLGDAKTEWQWRTVISRLSDMTVTTIHGFCFKLLREGLMPGIDPELRIISEHEARERVRTLYEQWVRLVTLQPDQLPNDERQLLAAFLSSESQWTEALLELFSDPGPRLDWKAKGSPSFHLDFPSILKEILTELDVSEILSSFDLESLAEHADKKWYAYIQAWNVEVNIPWDSPEALRAKLEFFEAWSGVRKPTPKQNLPAVEERMEAIKRFRDFFKKHAEEWIAALDHRDGLFASWPRLLKRIFDYIDLHYFTIPGATFGDLEYLVARGLQDDRVARRVQDHIRVLIVDEFQDTSSIQFQIIRRVIGDDWKRLFCVGDIKQAIYGFRGGEIRVFQEATERMPSVLELRNNYRSSQGVIAFNNSLFSHVFQLGLGFEGRDRHAVNVASQRFPNEKQTGDRGEIRPIRRSIASSDDDGPSTSDVESAEADELLRQISDRLLRCPNERMAVLYSKLAPARLLMMRLISKSISFSSQSKVPYEHDPIIGLFHAYLADELSPSPRSAEFPYSTLIMPSYFRLLDLPIPTHESLVESLQLLTRQSRMIGMALAFRQWALGQGMANSNHPSNMAVVNELCRLGRDRPSLIWRRLEEVSGGNYRFDFQFGDSPNHIQIMTAHASKGLEFPHVFIGGIHTNGRRMGDRSAVGRWPGSFRWKIDSSQKSSYKSPMFALESLVAEKKEFSESKRLFYVACTRAQQSLTWIDFEWSGKAFSVPKNSWAIGLHAWEETAPTLGDVDSISALERMRDTRDALPLDANGIPSSPMIDRPLFHFDSLGLACRPPVPLAISSELSVTRLSVLAHCVRKFYLKNICRLDAPSLAFMAGPTHDSWTADFEDERDERQLDGPSTGMSSSEAMERGTRLHAVIAHWIDHGTLPESLTLQDRDEKAVMWILDLLRSHRADHGGRWISEIPMKFSFFGQMISGTPDLIIIPDRSNEENAPLEIWDFKTGRRKEDQESAYHFQLMAYAYAVLKTHPDFCNRPIELVLAYLDQHECVRRSFLFEEIVESLYSNWKKTADFDQVNSAHCRHCEFGNICLFR